MISKKKLERVLKQSLGRSSAVTGVVSTLVWGYATITRLGSWGEPRRDILPKYIQKFCRKSAKAFGVEVVEVEPVPRTHGLWASNHISWMDIPVVGSVSRVFFLAKSEVATIPIMGALATAAGTMFIRRGSGDAGSVAMQIANFLKQGYSIIFFPEATTTDGKKIKKLQGKLIQAAIDADMPIQPVVLCYVNSKGELDSAIPYCGDMTLKQSLYNVMDSDPVTAYVLPLAAIYPEGRSRDELTEILQQQMQAGLEELHRRVLKA